VVKENRDEIPDTIDELLGTLKERRNVFRGLQSGEELEAWYNKQIDSYLERVRQGKSRRACRDITYRITQGRCG
jgi:hypothetical protein